MVSRSGTLSSRPLRSKLAMVTGSSSSECGAALFNTGARSDRLGLFTRPAFKMLVIVPLAVCLKTGER